MFSSQLKKQAHMRESILAILVILAICYMSHSIFYVPTKTKAKKLSEEIAQVDEKISGVKKLVETLKQKQKDETQEISKDSTEITPKNKRLQIITQVDQSSYQDVSEFLNAVTQPYFKSNVNIDSLKYDSPIMQKGYSVSNFHLVANGQFAQILEFIEKMEEMSVLITLDAINMNINQTDTNLVSIDLNGSYYQLEK